MSDLSYPIGKFEADPSITPEKIARWIDDIAAIPSQLRAAVAGLDNAQLDTPYRPGGWTVRQVVHHVADSHINCYLRIKFCLAEINPPVKAYDENVWVAFPDAKHGPVDVSLDLVDALHRRWVLALRNVTREQLERTILHSENGPMKLSLLINLYSWHGRHHVAHIASLRERMKW